MARDLAKLHIDTAFGPKVQLCKWLLYYYTAFMTLLACSGEPREVRNQSVTRSQRRNALNSEIRMLRKTLLYLGIDLMYTWDPCPKPPNYVRMPIEQSLELFIECFIHSASNATSLGALQTLMLSKQFVDRQRQNTAENAGIGLPSMIFICFRDRVVNCSADNWYGPLRTHGSNLSLARRERFTGLQEKTKMEELTHKVGARYQYIERVLNGTGGHDNIIARAKARTLSREGYNETVQSM